jgi:hypothetical protein
MKRNLFMLIAAFLFAANLFAQDVIALKTGEEIQASVQEVGINEIKYKRADNSNGPVYVLKKSEVFMIIYQNGTRDSFANSALYSTETRQTDTSIKQKSRFNKPKGYLKLVETGLGIENNSLSATMINGYRFAPQFAIGLGVGFDYSKIEKQNYNYYVFDYYDSYYYTEENIVLPVFIHLRSDFINRKVSPFASLNIGYNFNLSGGSIGGLMIEPILGISFNIGKKLRMMTGVGINISEVKRYGYDYFYPLGALLGGGYKENVKLKVGISF